MLYRKPLETDKQLKPSRAIRVTPPAPKFSDAERQAEFAAARDVLAQMDDNSMMILFSAEGKIYSNDVDFMYRQENNLYYLTDLKQNDATLVLLKDGASNGKFCFCRNAIRRLKPGTGECIPNERRDTDFGSENHRRRNGTNAFLQSLKIKSFSRRNTALQFQPKKFIFYFPNDAMTLTECANFERDASFQNL